MKFIIAITFCFFVFSSIGQIIMSPVNMSPTPIKKILFSNNGSNVISDTVQVKCGYDTVITKTYNQRTSCSPFTTKTQPHDSTYRKCGLFGWFCSTKHTTAPPHDTTYTLCQTYTDTIITKTIKDKYCDSIIYHDILPTTTLCMGTAIRDLDWVATNPKLTDWSFVGAVQNFVLKVSPDQVCPKEGVYDWSKFDSANAFADRAKAQGIPVHFKIRFQNGVFAPMWAKSKYGKFYLHGAQYVDAGWSTGADSFSVKTWDAGYVSWWKVFMKAVADHTRGNPYFSEIVISGTAAATAEPFNLAISNSGEGAQRRDDYLNAGCTDEVRIASLYASFDAMDVFDISFSIALNPYEHILPITYMDTAVSMQMGEYLAKKYGNRMALGNNGLRPAEVDVDWQPGGKMYALCKFYQRMKAQYGSKIYFQTASDKQIGLQPTDPAAKYLLMWQKTWDSGAAWGAQFLEVPDTEKTLKTVMGDQTNTIINKYSLLYKGNQ
jgi:hypothetical protein